MTEKDDTTAGGQVLIGSGAGELKLFVPSASGQPDLSPFERGDLLSATGVALQFCQAPPYNRFFELLVNDPAGIAVTERSWAFPPLALAFGLAAVLCVSFLLWSRERRLRKQRERLRKTYQLGEEVLGSSSVESILKRISKVLPGILGITRVQLFVHNRAANTLDAVFEDRGFAVSISLAPAQGGTPAPAAACFHYRTPLAIPDSSRSPFPIASDAGGRAPRSLLLVPMTAQNEVMGVLELDQDDRARDFTSDEQALAQYLGNQIGVAIRLLDQRSVQEQLFRTEKLAAVGRLISGIAAELQTPLASISELASKALEKAEPGPAGREVAAIAAEARKAAGMVARLTAFGGSDAVEARPVCVSTLLRSLIEFRQADWKASGIRIDGPIPREPLFVAGSLGQLEQVFLNLLVHAEQSLAEAPQKTITIGATVLNKRLLVEIAFTAPPDLHQADEAASVLSVTRSVIAGHGGEARLGVNRSGQPCFEVDLPLAAKERAAVPATGPDRETSRPMTALLIEPEEAVQRQILALLAAQGCRVVPVDNADSGLDLAQRMRFDLAFCSVHAPGLNWVELAERMQGRVGGFVLLPDRYDAELSADFASDGRFVLSKPVREMDLARVLDATERLAPARSA